MLTLDKPDLAAVVAAYYSCRKIRPGPGASTPAMPAGIGAGTSEWGKLTVSVSSSASLCQLKIPME